MRLEPGSGNNIKLPLFDRLNPSPTCLALFLQNLLDPNLSDVELLLGDGEH